MPVPDKLLNYLDGNWETPAAELPDVISDANSGQCIACQRSASAGQIDDAIAAAQRVHGNGGWRELAAAARANSLLAIADNLFELADNIAEADAVTTGVPITQTRELARIPAAAFRRAAALAAESTCINRHLNFEVERLPLGPAVVIAPWNAPAGIASHKIASALAAGCPVLFKPSEWSPLSGQLIARAIDRADLPAGAFQLLHGAGETGSALTRDHRVAAVSFTGGLAAGRAVAAACARQMRPAQLELGGNNPLVMLPDANPDAVVAAIRTLLTTLNGQWCRALGRVIVPNSMLDQLLAMAAAALDTLRIGASTLDDTELGPLAHRLHRDQVLAAIARYESLGGVAHRCGEPPALDGWFMQPTLVSGVGGDQALDEIFGPVATIHGYASIEQAVALANAPPYGLAAYVFGKGKRALEVARRLEAGVVKVNLATLLGPHPDAPRPVWKLSGIGDEGARQTFEFFRGSRVIAVDGALHDYETG